MNEDRPNTGALTSSEVFRINSTAFKVREVFDKAAGEARDEALWLSAICRQLLADNDRLRIEIERLTAKLGR